MSALSGTLLDFGITPLAGIPTLLEFVPSEAGVKGGNLFTAKPVAVTVDPDGDWSVTLESTDDMVPAGIFYTVRINQGSTWWDFYGPKLFIPDGTWTLDSLPGAPLAANAVLVSLDPPPSGYRGWYLNAPGPGEPLGDPDDPDSSGTGILEIVS